MNGDDLQTLENDWPLSIWVAQFHGHKFVITDDERAKELEEHGFEVERYTILKPRKWPVAPKDECECPKPLPLNVNPKCPVHGSTHQAQ